MDDTVTLATTCSVHVETHASMTKIAVKEQSVQRAVNAKQSRPVVPATLALAINSAKASLPRVLRMCSKVVSTPPTAVETGSVMMANVKPPVRNARVAQAKPVAMMVCAKGEPLAVPPKRLPKTVKAVKHASMVDAPNRQAARVLSTV